jgi:hypothetical protein
MELTHANLCGIAVRWLKRPNNAGGHGCHIAMSECRPETTGEAPDAIGFRAGHLDGSVVVEVKVSRSDFLADRAKPHRAEGAGMGTWRYYMAPAGLLTPEDMPYRWGLLEVNRRGHVKALAGPVTKLPHWGDYCEALNAFRNPRDVEREQGLLVRLLHRVGDVEALNLQIREAIGARKRMALTVDSLRKELKAAQAYRFTEQFPTALPSREAGD